MAWQGPAAMREHRLVSRCPALYMKIQGQGSSVGHVVVGRVELVGLEPLNEAGSLGGRNRRKAKEEGSRNKRRDLQHVSEGV